MNTQEQLRTAPNFRDFGGHVVPGGFRVRRGVLFRSGQLSSLSEVELEMILALRLKCVVDLRTLDERTRQPARVRGSSMLRFESAKGSLAELVGEGGSDHDEILQGFERFYSLMPELYADDFRALFERLADGHIPLLVNCTAGKDRTGVACALILSSLGVPKSGVIADYIETNARFGNLRSVRDEPPAGSVDAPSGIGEQEPRDATWAADPAFIERALATVTQTYGTVANYVTNRLGIGSERLSKTREALLEPV